MWDHTSQLAGPQAPLGAFQVRPQSAKCNIELHHVLQLTWHYRSESSASVSEISNEKPNSRVLFCVKSTRYGHDCSPGLMAIHAEPSNRTAHAAGKLNVLNPQGEDIPEDDDSRNPARIRVAHSRNSRPADDDPMHWRCPLTSHVM